MQFFKIDLKITNNNIFLINMKMNPNYTNYNSRISIFQDALTENTLHAPIIN